MSANDLSAVLWREREQLEAVLYKLETQQLLLTSGRTRWLAIATRELEQAAQAVRDAELGRAVASAGAARSWGLDENATLRELIDAASTDSWREVFSAHLQALVTISGEIAALRDANEQLLRGASAAAQETLAGIENTDRTYTADGSTASSDDRARFFDTAI